MPQATTGGAPIARRVAGGVVGAGILVVLLFALATLVTAPARIDPRGRESWRPDSPAFDATPRDVTLFVPACDVRAVRLQARDSASGPIAIEAFVAADDRAAARRGSPRVVAPVSGTYVVPLDDVQPPWRTPLILRIRALDGTVVLAARSPFAFDLPHPSLGTFACAFDGDPARAWLAIAGVVFVVAGAGVLAAGWLARGLFGAGGRTIGDDLAIGPIAANTGGVRRPYAALAGRVERAGPTAWRVAGGLATVMTGATVLLYGLVVPPFEPPDELAHLQYARYVATTASLPGTVPPHDSEWRASSYEWVQQPLYYIGAAAALRVAGLHTPAPQLTLNPRSRVQPRGTEPTIFQHGAPTGDRTGHRALALLRTLSLLMALATTWLVARLTRTVTDDPLIVATVAGGLALVPQWCAVMGAVSTDPPATLLAAAATLAVVGIGRGRVTPAWLLGAGLVIGAAYAVKATAAFLVPMAVLACVMATMNRGERTPGSAETTPTRRSLMRTTAPRLAWVGAGVLIAAGWIPLRAYLLYGDPGAFEFKRAILEAGGFVPTRGPMPWTAEFWTHMRVMVFEPFWARFGSLGAGPLPGSKVWLLYAGASAVLTSLAGVALATALRTMVALRRVAVLPPAARGRFSVLAICLTGVAMGLAGWVAVNLAPRADMVVHWTPRHILPLTAPAAVLVGAGLDALCRRAWTSRPVAALAGLTLVALAMAYLSVLRATLLMFHFGY